MMNVEAKSGPVVFSDDLKNPAIEKLELVRKWSINTYKCTKQILSEKLGRGSRTVDLELEAQIEILRDNKRKYEHIIKLSQTLATQLFQMVQTQRQLGDAFADLSLKSPELHEEFGFNADTQKLLSKNGETLLGAINFFISSVNTLIEKTIEDTMVNIKQYENARVEYDAYRTDLEELNLGPRDATTVPKIEVCQQQFQIHREKYEKMRNDVAIKLKFLEENKICILDSKRNMNVGIFLKQFKKTNESIIEDIRLGNSKLYGSETLKEFLKLLPGSEEVKKFKAFKGDASKLTPVDYFVYCLIQLPRFDVRVEAMVLKEEFFPSCSAVNVEIEVIRMAIEELMTCEELHAILHLVLQAGNLMNAGGYAGNAVGFKLSSLLKLADTKANKPGMNLLHFVALEAQKKDETLLKFPEKLQHVQSAVRISMENIEAEFQSLYARSSSVEEKIQQDTELLQQLEHFLQSSVRTLQDLKKHLLQLRKEGNCLIDFFCEDKESFKLDECFRIFQDFCLRFKKAVKDNLERDLKEAARQKRLRELEEKRHSWAGGDQGRGFGRSSSENDVEMLTKEGLLDFFQLAAMADRELCSFLGGLRSEDSTKFNSLPRISRCHSRKTNPWMDSPNDNQELGVKCQNLDRKDSVTLNADQEDFSQTPVVEFKIGLNIMEDPHVINGNTTVVSESGGINNNNHYKNVFEKTNGTSHEQMNVSVSRHTLVPGLQVFSLITPINNNSMYLVNQGDVCLDNLKMEKDTLKSPEILDMDTPPSSKSSKTENDSRTESDCKMESLQFTISSQNEEEGDISTISSTCDIHLPLDDSATNKKPILYIMDCTETDHSTSLDYSQIHDNLPVFKEDNNFGNQNVHTSMDNLKDPSSISSNLESESTNEESVSVTQSATTEEKACDSCGTTKQKKNEKMVQVNSKKTGTRKSKQSSKIPGTRNSGTAHGVRTLPATENQKMRKVMPISRQSRSGNSVKTTESSAYEKKNKELRHPHQDQSNPGRKTEYHTSTSQSSNVPAENQKVHKGTPSSTSNNWLREQNPRTHSIRKPSAKPVRNIPKPKPEEKMCRSTMRALAQAQGAAEGSSCQTPTHSSKPLSGTPSFARGTVASSSRRMKKDLTTSSYPSSPSNSATPTRTGSKKQTVKANPSNSVFPPKDEDIVQGTLKRAQSVKVSSKNWNGSEMPPHKRDPSKGSSFSEKSVVQSKDLSKLTTEKALKPMWK
ncbi:FHDC1 protein, partial [Amia calva]|nr:FHDC1 protein [Amia calva]